MDDLVVFSTDLDKLIELTGDLLKRFCNYGLKINPEKSSLFTTKARILGHDVDPEGTRLPLEYIEKVRKVPSPKTPKELQSFAAWCGKYCDYLADIAKPLFAISKVSARDFKKGTRAQEGIQSCQIAGSQQSVLGPL